MCANGSKSAARGVNCNGVRLPGVCITVASASLVCAGAAYAQSPGPDLRHPARCLIALATLASSDDASVKMSGLMGSLFFAGQIFGADPAVNLTTLLKREAAMMHDTQMRQSLVQCGEELKQRGGEISAAGEALKAMAPDTR